MILQYTNTKKPTTDVIQVVAAALKHSEKHAVPDTDCKCIVILGKQCEYCINMLIS